jgi:hypothetical protein
MAESHPKNKATYEKENYKEKNYIPNESELLPKFIKFNGVPSNNENELSTIRTSKINTPSYRNSLKERNGKRNNQCKFIMCNPCLIDHSKKKVFIWDFTALF